MLYFGRFGRWKVVSARVSTDSDEEYVTQGTLLRFILRSRFLIPYRAAVVGAVADRDAAHDLVGFVPDEIDGEKTVRQVG